MVNNLDYKDIKFLVSKKDYSKIEKKNNVCINPGWEYASVGFPLITQKQYSHNILQHSVTFY